MSQKPKPDLAAALAESGGSTRRRSMAEPRPRKEPAEMDLVAERNAGYQAPSRVGTAPITVHMPEAVRDQLKILAIEQKTTLHAIAAEAYNDLFAKYGKPEIAPHQAMVASK